MVLLVAEMSFKHCEPKNEKFVWWTDPAVYSALLIVSFYIQNTSRWCCSSCQDSLTHNFQCGQPLPRELKRHNKMSPKNSLPSSFLLLPQFHSLLTFLSFTIRDKEKKFRFSWFLPLRYGTNNCTCVWYLGGVEKQKQGIHKTPKWSEAMENHPKTNKSDSE